MAKRLIRFLLVSFLLSTACFSQGIFITDLPEAQLEDISTPDLLLLVDLDEVDPNDQAKKMTLENFQLFLAETFSGGGLDKWVTATEYEIDDVVWLEDDNKIYRATVAHTSGISFNPANWQELSDDVNGPSSSVDNAVARFDSTTGKLLQSSIISISDTGVIHPQTTDGSDNLSTLIAGGGAAIDSRGGWIGVYGNEHLSRSGDVIASIGEGSGSLFWVDCGSSLPCFSANRSSEITIGESGSGAQHTVNGDLSIVGIVESNSSGSSNGAEFNHNGSGDAVEINQSGAGLAVDINGDVDVLGDYSQDGDFSLSGLMTITDSISGLLLDILDTTGLVSLFKVDAQGPKKETASGDILIQRDNVGELMLDPSFEMGVSEGVASGCTATQIDANIMPAPDNKKGLEVNCSASTGTYTVTKTTGVNWNRTPAIAGCWIKTSAAGVKFHAQVNGSTVKTKDVSQSDTADFYDIPIVAGVTSVGFQVEASTSITDLIHVEKCTLSASEAPIFNKASVECDGTDLDCENNFSAKVSSTDVVSDENIEGWINGDCTNATTGEGTCAFATGLFTVAPNCTLTAVGSGSPLSVKILSLSNTSINYIVLTSSTTGVDTAVDISCQKQGADFKPIKQIAAVASQTLENVGNVYETYRTDAACNYGDLVADGSAVSRTDYTELFAVFGTTYGVGDGSTTFNLPNIAGDFCVRSRNARVVAELIDVVTSPGSSNGKPVIYSASVSSTGVVSNEVGDIFNGNCGSGSSGACTFNSIWSATPNCSMNTVGNTGVYCEFSAISSSSFSFSCRSDDGTSIAVDKMVICHGLAP